MLAERGGFEPPVPVKRYNCLAGSPVQPLQHLSNIKKPNESLSKYQVAVGEGFEPSSAINENGFQDRRLQPLGQPTGPGD